MKQSTKKTKWWLQIVASFCIFALSAQSAFAQEADESRLITSGIGKGQAAAQRTLSEIQTLNTLETKQEAQITAQQNKLANERTDLTTGSDGDSPANGIVCGDPDDACGQAQINQIETDIGVLETDLNAVEADLATIGQHAHTPISTTCNNAGSTGRKLLWNGTAWSCQNETDPNVGPHATTSKVPPDCNPSSQKLIWNGTSWACAIDVPGEGPTGNAGPAGDPGPDGPDGPTLWTVSGSNIYYSTGRVGVGTSSPATPLHVGGDMRVSAQLFVGGVVIPGNASLCDASREGALRFNTATDAMAICQNGSWINVLLGSAAPCSLPWGGVILHTQSTTAYQTATVPYGSSCNGQTRTCTNGVLSGSYTNASCAVNPPANCSVAPWGTINHGSSVTAYQSSSVTCGNTCSSQVRNCNNGVLSGSYTNASCSVGACANCSLDGATVNHGSSGTFYLTSRACGASCASVSQSRSCNNGTLSGSGSYSKASCPAAAACGCSLPWGGSIASGASVTAYLASSVTCGNTCTSQTRTCSNGSLSGSYTNQSCSVGGCASCPRPWGGTVAHGSSITAYASASPSCGTACASQTRNCNNGSLSGSYTNQSCTSKCCLPWGGSINSGSSTTAYAASSVPCGSSCSSQTRSCSGTTLSGSYTKSSCSVASCGCSLPWGGSISSGQSVTAYAATSVPCGSTCSSQTRTCSGTTLSGSYTKSSCSVGACASCTSPGGTTVSHGSCVSRYTKSSAMPCGGPCDDCFMYYVSWCCNNGSGSGTWGNYASCNNIGCGCFTPETKILMADGTHKAVVDLKVGDLVKGETQNNPVLKTPVLDKLTKLYSFNNETTKFVTAGHPFKTKDGWKSIDPNETPQDGHTVKVGKLEVGDVLIREDGTEVTIETINETTEKQSLKVYNPALGGDNTYYANGYLVHNKPVECY